MEKKSIATRLDEELGYWKGYISMHHVLACELSYSLIYNNINPKKLDKALSTVGLKKLPNRFLLIQVDDYHYQSSKMRITQEFFQKTELINFLRARMEEERIEGFLANLVGMDKIICFLCFDELGEISSKNTLLEIADTFKETIRNKSSYTISLALSKRCLRLADYSKMFPRMELALNRSFFKGKEFSISLEDLVGEEGKREYLELKSIYPELLAALGRRSPGDFEDIIIKLIDSQLEAQLDVQKSKMQMLQLIQEISEYAQDCGVPQALAEEINDKTVELIFASSFISDTLSHLKMFFKDITKALKEYCDNNLCSFKIPISQYIELNYSKDLRLKDLAKLTGYSEGHFARNFKEEFGQSFSQYLRSFRIEESKKLLIESSIPIEEIASQVGINSYSYYCSSFKKLTGYSPGYFRKKAKGLDI